MRRGDAYTLSYAAAVCLVSSLLLSAAASGLRDRQARMAEADRQFHVLRVFRAQVLDARGRRIAPPEIRALYARHVEREEVDPRTGAPAPGAPGALETFRWVEDGRVAGHAIPVGGAGVWGPIRGYLAVDGAGERILDLTFYRHQETPGLGGEIEREEFLRGFRGRRLFGEDGRLRSVAVAKGRAGERAREDAATLVVDGISGATLTGRAVGEFLTRDLAGYEAALRAWREAGR